MNRSDFQELAQLRLKEAQVLLQHGCAEGAYYLAGYVVECALKACIAKLTKKYDFPDKDRVNQSYVHDLNKLMDVAGLREKLSVKMKQDNDFAASWNTVKDWSEKCKYLQTIDKKKAEALLMAISDEKNGILPWLKNFW